LKRAERIMNDAPSKPGCSSMHMRLLGSSYNRRRASMDMLPLPSIAEEISRGMASAIDTNDDTATGNLDDDEEDVQQQQQQQQLRRSSVSFSAEITEVREYSSDYTNTRQQFYSEQEIYQFRQEARFERFTTHNRRASTGSSAAPLRYGMPVPNSYPYISPLARRGSGSSSESEDSSGNASARSSALKTSADSSPSYVPMVTFAKLASRKKEVRSLNSRMSHALKLDAGTPPSNPGSSSAGVSFRCTHRHGDRAPVGASGSTVLRSHRSTTTTTTTTTRIPSATTHEEKSYEFSSSGGFSVPLDEVRHAIGSTSNPQDLTGTQFVSVSCPLPDRPSTARIA